jgi:ATP-dependent Clp protease ATP-binding subunit ClpA
VLRGFDSAVHVYELAWGKDRTRSLPLALEGPSAAPMVGRTDEIGRGRMFVDAVARGDSSGLLLVGEPGIGKTRLAAAIAHAAVSNDFAGGHRTR